MKVDTAKEASYSEEYDPIVSKMTIETQHQNNNKQKELFGVLLVVDDFADDPKFVRYSNILHGLFTCGRHNAIPCILSSKQMY